MTALWMTDKLSSVSGWLMSPSFFVSYHTPKKKKVPRGIVPRGSGETKWNVPVFRGIPYCSFASCALRVRVVSRGRLLSYLI